MLRLYFFPFLFLALSLTACNNVGDQAKTEHRLTESYFWYHVNSSTGQRFFRLYTFDDTSVPFSQLTVESRYYPDSDPNYFFSYRGSAPYSLVEIEDNKAMPMALTHNYCVLNVECKAKCGSALNCEEWKTDSYRITGDVMDTLYLERDGQVFELKNTRKHLMPISYFDFNNGFENRDESLMPDFSAQALAID